MIQGRDLPFIVNLGNSIIGVSVLAIPFCFHQCGIILGSLLLFVSSLLTRLSCDILLRAANSTKKRSYEYLAQHTFGSIGKSLVEISIIGLLFGTCIAFHVIVGDLSPSIVSVLFGVENTPTLRAIVMVLLAICVALPLSLMRNIQSLSGISAVSLCFYGIFILQIFLSSLPNLITGALTQIRLWKFSGTFHCLPIFLMAFTCQTQLFLVYDALPEPSVNVMSSIVSSAVNMVSIVYFLVGLFGYTAFCFDGVKGDVLMNFGNGIVSALLKLGFVLSIVVSFPLAIFPCRASINSLMAKQSSSHEAIASPSFIPHNRFVIITVCVMTSTLVVGILIPQVEVILALTGAIMGTLICYIVPGAMFLHLTPAGAKQRQIAKIVLVIGLICLVTSSFTIIGQLDVKKAQPQMQAVDIKDKQDNLLPGKNNNPFKKPVPKDGQKDPVLNDQKNKVNSVNDIKDTNGNKPHDKDQIKQNDPKVPDNDPKKKDLANNPDSQNHINPGKDQKPKDIIVKEVPDSNNKQNSKSAKVESGSKTGKSKDKNSSKKSKDDQRLEPIAPEDSVNENANKMIKSLEKRVQDLKDLKKSAEKSIEKSKHLIASQNNSSNNKRDIQKGKGQVSDTDHGLKHDKVNNVENSNPQNGEKVDSKDNNFQKGKGQVSDTDHGLKHDKVNNVESNNPQNGEKVDSKDNNFQKGKGQVSDTDHGLKHDKVSNVENNNLQNSEKLDSNGDTKNSENHPKFINSELDQSKKRDSKSKESETVDDNVHQKSVKHENSDDKEKVNQVSNSNKFGDPNTKIGNENENTYSKKSKLSSDTKSDKISGNVDSGSSKSHKSASKDSVNDNGKSDEADLSSDGSKSKSEEHHLDQKEKVLKRTEVELEGMKLKLKELELKLKEDKIQGEIEKLKQKTRDLNNKIIKKTEEKSAQNKKALRKKPISNGHIKS